MGLQVNGNITNDFMQYYHFSAAHAVHRAVVSVSLINLPLSHDWRDQHVLIILPWFELDQRSVQLHKHSTSEPDKHSASALCIQKEVQGQGKTRSVCLSGWLGIAIGKLFGLFSAAGGHTRVSWQVWTWLCLISHSSTVIKRKGETFDIS